MNRDPLTRDADPFWFLLAISIAAMTAGATFGLGIWVALGTWWPG